MPKGRVSNAVSTAGFLARHPAQSKHMRGWVAGRFSKSSDATTPWWVFDAVDWVGQHLDPKMDVLEFGSGASTGWLAQRVNHVYSVEHERNWYESVRGAVPSNVSLRLAAPSAHGTVASGTVAGYFDSYVEGFQDDRGPELYGLVVVDGRARLECFRRSIAKIAPGGALLLDDSDRPQYAEAKQLCEWPRHDFRGLKRGVGMIASTTCWQRPLD